MPQAESVPTTTRRNFLTTGSVALTAVCLNAGDVDGALAAISNDDSELLDLLRQALEITKRIEMMCAQGAVSDEDLDPPFAALRILENKIIPMRAVTLDGLRGKARLMTWCHGEVPLDDPKEYATDKRLCFSIIRDLSDRHAIKAGL